MGSAVGNGLMSCGCLLMILPIFAVIIFGIFALSPTAGVILIIVGILGALYAIGK